MTDEKKNPEELFDSDNFSLDDEEDNWGEDWESAFQAEEDVFSPEESGESEDIFFEQSTGIGTAEATASAGTAQQSAEADDAVSPSPAAAQRLAAFLGGIFKRFAGLAGLLPWLKNRFLAFRTYQRLAAAVLAAGLCAAAIFLAYTNEGEKQPADTGPTVDHLLPAPEASVTGNGNLAAEAEPEPEGNAVAEKVRQKLFLPAFFIPVTDQKNRKEVAFLDLDITLYLLVDENQDIAEQKKILARDIIYQFFSNRPMEDLRRYSLARGEMGRALRSWLNRQWPDNPIESIAFNHYHIT